VCEAHFFTFRRVSVIGTVYGKRNSMTMLTKLYIETLLVDKELADQVWAAWDVREIDDLTALSAWWCILFDDCRG